jgi:hypothetical protein
MVRRRYVRDPRDPRWRVPAPHPWRIWDSRAYLNAAYCVVMQIIFCIKPEMDQKEIMDFLYDSLKSYISVKLRFLIQYVEYELEECSQDQHIEQLSSDTLRIYKMMSNIISSILFKREYDECVGVQDSTSSYELEPEDSTGSLGSWEHEKLLNRLRRNQK